MKWTDTYEIVDALIDAYPEQDPEKLLFTDLYEYGVLSRAV